MKSLIIASAVAALALAGAAAAQPRGGGGPSITLYDLPNYQGASRTYSSGVDNLADLGLNDRAQSVRVQGRWRLCTDAKFRGRCVEVSGDVPNLATLGVTAAVSSFDSLDRGGDQYGGRDYRGGGADRGGGYDRGPGFDRGGGYDRGPGPGGPGVPAYGPPPSYGRNDAGQSLEGRGATFFPRPNPGPYRSADEFCRRLGFSGAIYADDRGRDLSDVLCRR